MGMRNRLKQLRALLNVSVAIVNDGSCFLFAFSLELEVLVEKHLHFSRAAFSAHSSV